uniref:Uncharacterized protein n=1 Tax=Percolomonas cosmopolitus TaxID=63605 RepID=A0A7S1PH52_9EUKA|mmetsp:Transcript_11430/g.42932  ORF Transcript_11430/g.42932 Transcript_11430/m.42932 type:complete len:1311 (+) Transcript_11430:383-4315(+)
MFSSSFTTSKHNNSTTHVAVDVAPTTNLILASSTSANAPHHRHSQNPTSSSPTNSTATSSRYYDDESGDGSLVSSARNRLSGINLVLKSQNERVGEAATRGGSTQGGAGTPKLSPASHSAAATSIVPYDASSPQDLFHWKLSEITHYLMLHHLRADLRNHVTLLTQSTYDVLSFKNLLFSMYQKPISYEMLQDLILLSSQQYRVTMDLHRDLSNFFRICFLGEKQEGYDAEDFEGQPIYATAIDAKEAATSQRDTDNPSGKTSARGSPTFFPQLLKILEKRVLRGHTGDESQLNELQKLAEEHVPERTDDNYDFTAFRLLMRQYKECMSLIVKQEDDLHEATNHIEEMEPKLKEQREINDNLQKENETLRQKLLAMEQRYDETFDHVSGTMFNQSGQQIRKAKSDQKLNKKYVSQLGKKFNDTVITISSRLRLFHRTLLDVMDDDKSKLSVESNVKMNTMIVHVTHLIQKFEDIRGALVEISNELDKVLKSKIQTATSGLTTMKSIAKENKKVLKAKKTLSSMNTYLSDLKTVSQLLEDYQYIRPATHQASSGSNGAPSDEILNKVRSLITQNVNGVNIVHDEVHEVLSSINLTAARNVEKEKKKKHDKKVNRFNLTVPILQSRSEPTTQQEGDQQQDQQIHGGANPPPLDSSAIRVQESVDSMLSAPLSSWNDKRNSARKPSFEEISSSTSLSVQQTEENRLKEKYNEKISFVKEVYDSRVKDLQSKLSLAHERIKELEKKRSKESKIKLRRNLTKNSNVSHLTDRPDDESQPNEVLHEFHFAEDFNYVDPDLPDEMKAVSQLKMKTEKMMQGLGVIQSDEPVTRNLKRELKKKAKEKIKMQRRGKKSGTDTFSMLQQLSPTMRDYSLASPSDDAVSSHGSVKKARRRTSQKKREAESLAVLSRSRSSSAASSSSNATGDMTAYPNVLDFMHYDDQLLVSDDEQRERHYEDEGEDADNLYTNRHSAKQGSTAANSETRLSQLKESRKRKQSPKKSLPQKKRGPLHRGTPDPANKSRDDEDLSRALSTTPSAEEHLTSLSDISPGSSSVRSALQRKESEALRSNSAGSRIIHKQYSTPGHHNPEADVNVSNMDTEEETILSPDLIAPSSWKGYSSAGSLRQRNRPILIDQKGVGPQSSNGSPQQQIGRPYSQGAANPHIQKSQHYSGESYNQPHDEYDSDCEDQQHYDTGDPRERRRSNSADDTANNLVTLPSIMTPFEGPPQTFRGTTNSTQGKQQKWLSNRMKLLQQDTLKEQKRYISNIDVFSMFNDDTEPMKPVYAPAATSKLGSKSSQVKKKNSGNGFPLQQRKK